MVTRAGSASTMVGDGEGAPSAWSSRPYFLGIWVCVGGVALSNLAYLDQK